MIIVKHVILLVKLVHQKLFVKHAQINLKILVKELVDAKQDKHMISLISSAKNVNQGVKFAMIN